MIGFTVNIESYSEWVYKMHHRFQIMVQTMIDIHHLIQANTNQLVPLDTGRLEESFHYTIVDNESFIELHSIYSAVDPDSGFDYAYYQYLMPTESHYNRANRKGQMRGEQYYLLKGVQASEDMMWTMIEKDYLSLFNGGI